MNSLVYNQKLQDILDDNYTYEQISLQSVLNNINDFNKSYKILISWSSLISY